MTVLYMLFIYKHISEVPKFILRSVITVKLVLQKWKPNWNWNNCDEENRFTGRELVNGVEDALKGIILLRSLGLVLALIINPSGSVCMIWIPNP